jgi:hypothetical protein
MPSITQNDKAGKAPQIKTAKQPTTNNPGFQSAKAKKALQSGESTHAPANKTSIGLTTTMHGKTLGGHPAIRGTEFSGKGRGHHIKPILYDPNMGNE